MQFRLLALAILFLDLQSSGQNAGNSDYGKEPVVIENMATDVIVSPDGTRERRETLSVRVQSEGVLRQFGVLSFSYASASEELTVDYIRVRKQDGSVIATPESSMVDTAVEMGPTAPTYSDLRQKQIAVKALEVGETLEYAVRVSQRKPEVPGQFWYQHVFPDDAVVLSATLTVSVPKETHLQIASPRVKYETREESGLRVYLWHYTQLDSAELQAHKREKDEIEQASVRMTTFKNWEEVGSWWGSLAAPAATATAAVQEKAKELTAGLTNNGEKARVLYKYVATKYRYISISFGIGRYRPHTADEVLANQYGDCKDKHTLLAALLKAAGIEAWPTLIGAGIKLDQSVPSPDQFNHVITVLPQDGKYIWLDTTQEVASFGLLSQLIRDEQALVIPLNAKAFLLKTPADPPFRTSEVINLKSSLSEDGSLSGQFDIRMLGDTASILRAAFRQVSPAQWQALAQQISAAMSYAGEVSDVQIEKLDDLDEPFHYTYDYKRAKYSDWAEAKITPPLPPLGFGPGDEAEKPKEPFLAGTPGEVNYSATVLLPKGFSIELPPNVSLTSEFADYSAEYSFKDGAFAASRKLTVKKSKVTLDQWASYQTFAKSLRGDQAQFLMVAKADSSDNAGARPSILKAPVLDADPVSLLEGARAAGRDYALTINLAQQANAIWKKRGEKPPEYAESLVTLSVAKFADDYATSGAEASKEKLYSQWKLDSADFLNEAVNICRANPGAKPDVLALALELQALPSGDGENVNKLRDQAAAIRGNLVHDILPEPAQAVTAGGEPLQVQGQVQPPTLLKRIEPGYSEAAREIRIEGTVHLAIIIEKDGKPSSVHLLKGLGFGLDEEAAKAVKQWRFNPGTLDGKPVRIRAKIDVGFKIL